MGKGVESESDQYVSLVLHIVICQRYEVKERGGKNVFVDYR